MKFLASLCTSLCLTLGTAALWADQESFFYLDGVENYGSGPAIIDNLYTLGGIEGVGLFIGNPNALLRKDRVLLRYQVQELLMDVEKVKSAHLVFRIDYMLGPDEERELGIEAFLETLDALEGTAINSVNVEAGPILSVARYDAANGGSGREIEVDVTDLLKSTLTRGVIYFTLRIKDMAIENASAASLDPTGIVIDRAEGRLPFLKVVIAE